MTDGDGTSLQLARLPVWRRISPAMEPAGTTLPQRHSPAGSVCGVVGTGGGSSSVVLGPEGAAEGRAGRQRRRGRPRHRRCVDHGHSGSPPALHPVPDTVSALALTHGPVPENPPPPCIINWSDRVTRAEVDLKQAVVVTVISPASPPSANAVAAVITAHLEVMAASLVLCRASSSSYLLFLPDTALVDHLISLQHPLRSPDFSLLCKRWSRLAGASMQTLPHFIEVELRGIPAHVWEFSTTEQF